MQHDERDVQAILEFDLAEETIGTWLRCIMHRLEEKRDLGKQAYRVYGGITSKVARSRASSRCFDSDSCPGPSVKGLTSSSSLCRIRS